VAPKDKPIYVIGEVGIEQELDLLGFQPGLFCMTT